VKTVLVIGAGPAGLFAAQKLALAGHQVVILNRDVKPGGLAEYGIYPTKQKMKDGLRKQFSKILALPNIHYFGHVAIGSDYSISIGELRQLQPDALVFAIGAQGFKDMGIPGEDAKGVYSAKDFVYFYNQLPPFASRDFSIGKRVGIIGMGNVMTDVARWIMNDDPNRIAEEVIVVARRGPFEAKFDKKEFAEIDHHLDRYAFQQELQRITPHLAAVGQDPAKVAETTFPIIAKPDTGNSGARLKFRFLSSPRSITADASGRIAKLEVTENTLITRDGSIVPKATSSTAEIEVDTLIFAIGDVVDPSIGLPWHHDIYVTNPEPKAESGAYEVFDPAAGKLMTGTYVVGWARKASEGLVGIARHDAEVGAGHILKYLESVPDKGGASAEHICLYLRRKGVPFVTKEDLVYLAQAESEEAQSRGIASFKFADDEAMLRAIEERKTVSPAVAG